MVAPGGSSLTDLHGGLARVFILNVAAEAASFGHFVGVSTAFAGILVSRVK